MYLYKVINIIGGIVLLGGIDVDFMYLYKVTNIIGGIFFVGGVYTE